jgi:hypothetical protein
VSELLLRYLQLRPQRGQESRLWNSPQVVATESKNRDTGARWNPLEHAPMTCLPWESQRVVLLGPKVWNGCQRGQELAIGIACLITWTPLTGDQDTHTYLLCHHQQQCKIDEVTNLQRSLLKSGRPWLSGYWLPDRLLWCLCKLL